jgi:hypothetical protein
MFRCSIRHGYHRTDDTQKNIDLAALCDDFARPDEKNEKTCRAGLGMEPAHTAEFSAGRGVELAH